MYQDTETFHSEGKIALAFLLFHGFVLTSMTCIKHSQNTNKKCQYAKFLEDSLFKLGKRELR